MITAGDFRKGVLLKWTEQFILSLTSCTLNQEKISICSRKNQKRYDRTSQRNNFQPIRQIPSGSYREKRDDLPLQ